MSRSISSAIPQKVACVAKHLLCLCFLMTSIASPLYASMQEFGSVLTSAAHDSMHHANMSGSKADYKGGRGHIADQSAHQSPCHGADCDRMHHCADNCPMNTCCTSVSASPTALPHVSSSNSRRCPPVLFGESPVLTRTTEPLFRPPIT